MSSSQHTYTVQDELSLTRAEHSRTEQNRTEQNRTEQSRAEQSRAEQSRAEQSRAEQSRTVLTMPPPMTGFKMLCDHQNMGIDSLYLQISVILAEI